MKQATTEATAEQPARQRSARRATGPRTKRGKARTKFNAVTHGIFASVVLEGRESRRAYERLLCALLEDIPPEGAQEELLVGKLAMLYWRARRVLEAEKAEILKRADFTAWDNTLEQLDELKDADRPINRLAGGLLQHDRNPLVLQRCIGLLKEWREIIAETGFDLEYNTTILNRIYGLAEVMEHEKGLPAAFCVLHALSQGKVQEQSDTHHSPEQRKKSALYFIGEEIKRLAAIQQELERQQAKRLSYEENTHMVPVAADRLIRYETMLSRETEKTQKQLERLQQRRRERKDLRTIKLDVST